MSQEIKNKNNQLAMQWQWQWEKWFSLNK